MSRCSREKVLMCKQKRELESTSKYRGSSVYCAGKCGKLFDQLLSTFSVTFSSPFFGVKLLYDYGFR